FLDVARSARGTDRARDGPRLRRRLRLVVARSALGIPFNGSRPWGVRPGALEYRPRPLHGVDAEPRALRSAFLLPRPLLAGPSPHRPVLRRVPAARDAQDRKSTRLNSSHEWISYAVFC